MSATPSPNDPRAVGTAIACYTLWGLLPLLFMAMAAHLGDAAQFEKVFNAFKVKRL